ncbi:hypothetical protein ACHAWF_003211 [Thalassiosira exigua]
MMMMMMNSVKETSVPDVAAAGAATGVAGRDDIMNQIASQAASVLRTFEKNGAKRKHTISSATAAAAQHMASVNRKRKFENQLAARAASAVAAERKQAQPPAAPVSAEWGNPTSGMFYSAIASHTSRPASVQAARPEDFQPPSGPPGLGHQQVHWQHQTHQQQHMQQPHYHQQQPLPGAEQKRRAPPPGPRVSDGIVLRATPTDITVSYNDVVCGKGKTTSSLVGNQRYKVWIDLHKEAFAKAPSVEDRRDVARSVVNAVQASVPEGRFLSLDIHTGLWYDVGRDRAVGITMEALMAETGMMKAVRPRPAGRQAQRTFVPRAA